MFVCLFVCPFLKRFSSSYTVENASNAALIPTSPEMKPGLAAVGSATVAVLQGHVVYNNSALYIFVQTVPWLLLL